MVDVTMISGAVSALNAARDIAKLIVASHDANAIREKTRELNTQILSAQEQAVSAYAQQLALLQRVGELEQQVADLKTWDADKARYELHRLPSGSLAYALKEAEGGSEPPHYICAACYQRGLKSILQKVPYNSAKNHLGIPPTLRCPECKTEITDA